MFIKKVFHFSLFFLNILLEKIKPHFKEYKKLYNLIITSTFDRQSFFVRENYMFTLSSSKVERDKIKVTTPCIFSNIIFIFIHKIFMAVRKIKGNKMKLKLIEKVVSVDGQLKCLQANEIFFFSFSSTN